MQSLPDVLTNGRFQLVRHNIHVKHLCELINVRNRLIHIDEAAMHLIGPNHQVKVEEDQLVVRVPKPEDLWGAITLPMVENYQVAVDLYFREVLFPESGNIEQGTIIAPI